MSDIDLDQLRSELDEFAEPEKKGGRPPREERIIAGFEEIQRFVETHGRAPLHGEERDIFERLYAVRLDRLRTLEECRSMLTALDHQGLLDAEQSSTAADEGAVSDEELLAEELQELSEADFDLSLTGFDPGEIDDLVLHPDDDEADTAIEGAQHGVLRYAACFRQPGKHGRHGDCIEIDVRA